MKNETKESMQSIFDSIRETVKAVQSKIDGVIADAAKENAEAFKFTEPYRTEKQNDLRNRANVRISDLKARAEVKCNALFTNLDRSVREWIKSAPSQDADLMIRSYREYDLKPSATELQCMKELCMGSYTSMRILDSYAQTLGVDVGFVSADTISGMVRTAKSETINAIVFYAGEMDEGHKYVSTYLGLDCGTSDAWHMLPIAERFMSDGADNAFSRLETLMLDSTESDFAILPETRRQLDEIFKDLEPDERVSVAKTLVEGKGALSNVLQLYDSRLYTDAVVAIAADKLNALNTADNAVHEALKQSASAYAESKSATKRAREAKELVSA